jgi:DNA mismatch endonuclease (patch repair protein)
MSRVPSKNTKPEIVVRKMLHRLGYRYRLHGKGLPGKPDIVFSARKKAIFVHGCFWHSHGCKMGREPKSNLDFWRPKLAANRKRDRRNQFELEQIGWRVETVWQCELKEFQLVERKLVEFLGRTNSIDIHEMF